MNDGYPKREKFFSHRFVRLLAKCCVANEIGPAAAYMLTVIVNTEDASHYRRGVTYYDGQLMPIIGAKSKKVMTQIRKRAVDAGWLHFDPGHKGKASTYWVTIPANAENIDDLPTDEAFDQGLDADPCPLRFPKSDEKGTNAEPQKAKVGTSKGTKGGHYNPIPNPIPSFNGEPKEKTPAPAPDPVADLTEKTPHTLATEFHFRHAGPLLTELADHFAAKLDWLKGQGRDEYDFILSCIKSQKRDPTTIATIRQMFIFWDFCERESDGRDFGGIGKKANSSPAKRSVPGGDGFGDSKRHDGRNVKVFRPGESEPFTAGDGVAPVQAVEPARQGTGSDWQGQPEPVVGAGEEPRRKDLPSRGHGVAVRAAMDGKNRDGNSHCLGVPGSSPGGSVHTGYRPSQRFANGFQPEQHGITGSCQTVPKVASADSGRGGIASEGGSGLQRQRCRSLH